MKNNLSSKINLSYIDIQYYHPEDNYELAKVTRMEKIDTELFIEEKLGSIMIANEISKLIHFKQQKGEICVLGLTNGKSMMTIYSELIRQHKEESLDFQNVHIVLLYEFYPLTSKNLGCFAQLNELFFKHINIPFENLHSPYDIESKQSIFEMCRNYDSLIEQLNGIDLQLIGIGKSGNIGYNESGSLSTTKTRLIMLDSNSRNDASKLFGNISNVPPSAISQGIATILKSKKIILIAWGEHKSDVLKDSIEGPITEINPASYLQLHQDTKVIADLNAAIKLTRISKPWLVGSCVWNEKLIRKAIVWLSLKTNKPILKLTDKDYIENGLNDLLVSFDTAYNINIKVFNDLQKTITGWPGGKPDADDSNRPERAIPYPKTVLIFSPHPDDDVISMGGTLKRLIDQKHQVHIAYQTSGNIAVSDEEVTRYLKFMMGYHQIFDSNNEKIMDDLHHFLNHIKLNYQDKNKDNRDILQIKTLIRKCEASLACSYLGAHSQNLHFLNLPFYEKGTIKKNPIGNEDFKKIYDLICELKPDQIYVAGDLGDPHGTHKVCLDAILNVIDELKHEEWMANCRIWMYRGAWLEWEIELIDMAVPLSPDELKTKRNAILRHHSQMEGAPFLGNDERLFWQRAEDRNHSTANLYTKLGLASYEAIEAFVRYYPI